MNTKPLRILLVEDNAQNRYLMRFLLVHRGHEVAEATSGAAGIALAGSFRPDVIVLDIQMPDMDGYEVALILKNAPATQAIPLLAATSFAMLGDRARALAIGFSDYIEKPYDVDLFVGCVETLGNQHP
jgi:two-component system, cell cycle response regulator DivK